VPNGLDVKQFGGGVQMNCDEQIMDNVIVDPNSVMDG
jgi:hypothetical protein